MTPPVIDLRPISNLSTLLSSMCLPVYLSPRTPSPYNQKHTSEVGNARLGLLVCDSCLVCLLAPLPAESSTTHSTAMPEALIGTWRLLTIEYSGPVGPLPDPLFWPGSQGLIMYDRSGWMSVQIYAPNRPPAKGPPRTSGAKLSVDDAGLKAAGFDTYYALRVSGYLGL
jgi:hypothetical protein